MKILISLFFVQIVPGFETSSLVKNTGFGFYFVLGERFGLCSSFEARLGENTQGGIKPAFLFKSNQETKAGVGVDGFLKFLIFKRTKDYPFNFSLIPHSAFYVEKNLFHFCFIMDFLIDYPIQLEKEFEIIPYGGGGLGIDFESKEIKGENKVDVEPGIEVKIGSLFKFTKKSGIFTEIFISNFNSALGLGVHFEI
jgi:hypothetical protein